MVQIQRRSGNESKTIRYRFLRLFSFIILVSVFLLTAVVFPSSSHAETIEIGGTGASLGIIRLLAQAFTRNEPTTTITVLPSLGSSGGVRALIAGAIDIALTARPLKKKEKSQGAHATEYARSPFVLGVRSDNHISSLTTKDLVDILNGSRTTWPDGTQIRLILRPKRDSASVHLQSISPQVKNALQAARKKEGLKLATTDQDAASSIENIPGALGTSVLSLILSESRKIKPLVLNGVAPTPRAIEEGKYQYFVRFYFATGPRKPSALAQRFLSFVRSKEGERILSRNGNLAVRTN